MAASRRNKGVNLFVYILIGMLILGLAGFGIGSFTSSTSTIGTVGDEEITVDDYIQQLNSEIDSFSRQTGQRLTALQAVQFGLGQNALERLVLDAAIDNEARRVRISVGDETVAAELTSMPQFAGIDGNFNLDSYNFTLRRIGTTASEFDQTIREAQTRLLIMSSLSNGIPVSQSFVDRLSNYYLSTRDITWARVEEDMLEADMLPPTDQELQEYYEANKDEFTLPEVRHATVAWITPENLSAPESIDESRIEALYEERIDQFSKPERRDVDRLVFPDLLLATSSRERLDSGEINFDELAQELGIVISDINLGIVERSDVSEQAADALFAEDASEIVGPVESSLGPAIFRVNAVLGEQFTSFEDASESLSQELALEDATSSIIDNISAIEDLLAGGATIEELAAETILSLENISFDENLFDGIGGFTSFRNAITSVQVGDFPELLELQGGGLFALRLDEIEPATLQPLNDVRDSVAEGFERRRLSDNLKSMAEDLASKLQSGSDFESLELEIQNANEVTRNQSVSGAPIGLSEKAFSLNVLESAPFGEELDWGVLLVNSETLPNSEDENNASILENLNNQFTSGVGRDVVALYSNYLQKQSGLRLNREVLDTIHAQFQ